MLAPKSIAIVGASRKRTGPTGMLLDLVAEYPGAPPICIVNPSGESIDGLPTYRTVADIPDAVDLALLLVPAAAAESSARECAAHGIANLAVFSAGFADDRDVAGHERQAALAQVHAETGARILGPNSQGFLNLVEGVPATFSPAVMPSALARYFDGDKVTALERARATSPSSPTAAAWGSRSFNRGVARGVGFSYVISTGNEVDVEVTDCLEFLLEDSHTDVVMMYLEGLQRPNGSPSWPRVAQAIGTRLVVAKLGRSEAAARAASVAHRSSRRRRPRLRRRVSPLRRGPCARSRRDARHGGRVVVVPIRRWPRGRRRQCVGRFGSVAGRLVGPRRSRRSHPASRHATPHRKELPSFASVVNPVDITGAVAEGAAEILHNGPRSRDRHRRVVDHHRQRRSFGR